MPIDKERSVLALAEEQVDEQSEERQLYLDHGRTLAVGADGLEQVLEIRAASGRVELRIKMTEEGPVLQAEGLKLSVKAAESLDLECKTLKIAASEGVELATAGPMTIASEGEMKIESKADVKVVGECIYLN
jgi:hypothetical protein